MINPGLVPRHIAYKRGDSHRREVAINDLRPHAKPTTASMAKIVSISEEEE
jgi:hypothetical protein